MRFITKNRIKNWLLIFLLVTNVATISTIFYHRWSFRKHMKEMSPHQKMKDFINNDLGLSEAQKIAFDKERETSDSIKEIYFTRLENLRISVYSQFSTSTPDSSVIDSLVKNMSDLYSEINRIGITHNLFMLKSCTSEQKTKLQKKYEEMVEEMSFQQHNWDKKKDHD